MSQERVSIWRGTAMHFWCSMTWMIFLLMTLSSINNWSVEMRSTKAELLHWNFWQYEKLLCSSCNLVITTLRFHTAYCHTYSEVTHITRWPFSWKKCFLHLTQNNLGHRSVHLLTSDVVSLSLSTVTVATSNCDATYPVLVLRLTMNCMAELVTQT